MVGHFGGDIRDALGQLHHHVDDGVFLLELLALAFRQVSKGLVELLIQFLAPELPITGAGFPQQPQRGPIADRVSDGVPRLHVSLESRHARVVGGEFAAKGSRRVVIVYLDGRAGEAEERRLLEHVAHGRAEIAFLGAVRFVHEHDHVAPVHPEIARLKLLHDRHDDAPVAVAQLREQILAAGGDVAVLRVGAEELAADLILQLIAIHDDEDRRHLERWMKPHLPRGEEHGQALARALCVPDETAPPAAWFVGFQRTLHQFVGTAELLPPGDLLDALPLVRVEDDEVAQDVEQVGPVAEAVDAALQFVVAIHMAMRVGAAPGLPVVKLHAGHAVAQGDLIHADAEDVRVI